MNEYLIHVFFLILLIYIIMNLNINDLYHKLYLNNLYLIKILIIYLNLYPEIIELNNFLMIYPFLESLLLYKLFPLLVIELILFFTDELCINFENFLFFIDFLFSKKYLLALLNFELKVLKGIFQD